MQRTGPYPSKSPFFHEGELWLQEVFGVKDRVEMVARRLVLDRLDEQHRDFYSRLPFVIVGSVDEHGQPWASFLTEDVGFADVRGPHLLRLNAKPFDGDPLRANLRHDAPIGLLGIDLETRHRNRISGRVVGSNGSAIDLRIVQSYMNCQQYIQSRTLVGFGTIESSAMESDVLLSFDDIKMIGASDSFYIASAYSGNAGDATAGADVSHRGGRPGFVRVDDPRTITVPDFVGNWVFNTLGNLVLDPRAGLLFVDFTNGNILMIASDTEIIWSGVEVDNFVGARRVLRFRISKVLRLKAVMSLRMVGDVELSPEALRTGTWKW